MAKITYGRDRDKLKKWADARRKELNRGDVEQIIFAIKSYLLKLKRIK